MASPYYRSDLALVHHKGFAFHAKACAPGVLAHLEPIRGRNGLVLEIGCGSGLLTKELVEAGHRVIATDASRPMLDLAKSTAPGVEQLAVLDLPDDPVPSVDAIVGVGHALNYLSSAEQITEAVRSLGKSLRPGGVVALDVCDLAWGPAHTAPDNLGRVGEDWAIISRFSTPSPDRYVREMTTFVTNSDGSWRRDDERHENVLVDVSVLAGVFDEEGVHVEVGDSFGQETLPIGLRTIIGSRPG